MLNISENSIKSLVAKDRYVSFRLTSSLRIARLFRRFLLFSLAFFCIIIFFPWTQNVQGTGQITALTPDSRPQTLQSPIPGKILAWYVREGDTVQRGDTIVHIGEVKNEYLDVEVKNRTEEELAAKQASAVGYEDKMKAQEEQLVALEKNKRVKLAQTLLKIQSDSTDQEAAKIALENARLQMHRADSLYRQGIKSKYDFELRVTKYQEAQSKYTAAANKYRQSQQQIDGVKAEYGEKIAKARAIYFEAQSALQNASAEIAKLRNKLANLEQRQKLYYVTAPQHAMVTKALLTGISENIKPGQPIVELLPLDYEQAAEMYVRPVDLPLIKLGGTARLQFDGWPAIVFSGWPNTSFGTFPAKVVAIDNVISPTKGGYRVLLVPSDEEQMWPEQLRIGSGVHGIMLLNDVPLWYEIWRQLNGFPPEYYVSPNEEKSEK